MCVCVCVWEGEEGRGLRRNGHEKVHFTASVLVAAVLVYLRKAAGARKVPTLP
jgi:hypothetical protein